MRAAGCDHGIEKRRSMCGLIWLPSPSEKRPFDASCRSLAIDAMVIGVRAKAMATPVDSSSRSVARAASSSGKKGSWLVSAVAPPS